MVDDLSREISTRSRQQSRSACSPPAVPSSLDTRPFWGSGGLRALSSRTDCIVVAVLDMTVALYDTVQLADTVMGSSDWRCCRSGRISAVESELELNGFRVN